MILGYRGHVIMDGRRTVRSRSSRLQTAMANGERQYRDCGAFQFMYIWPEVDINFRMNYLVRNVVIWRGLVLTRSATESAQDEPSDSYQLHCSKQHHCVHQWNNVSTCFDEL